MNRVLFMTVGTGMGTDAKSKTLNLAHGLLASIEHYHPDFVIFFGSEESRVTIESLRAQYLVKQGQNITHYEFVPLTKIDEFDHCFTVIARKILERPNEEIIIDYTSGTKTMTMCAALASMLYHKKLTLISGTRGSNGAVTPGTEEIHEQNLYSAYDVELERHLCTLFNLNRFEEAEDILHKILSLDAAQRSFYDHLLAGYSSWDKFHHKDAYIHIKEIKPTQFAPHKEFLGKLKNTPEPEQMPYLIADLLNNANRRIAEAKFDDGVARLYRAIELIAQYVLKSQYNLVTSDVHVEELKTRGLGDDVIEKYEQMRDEAAGKNIKLALTMDYELLRDLTHPLGTSFFEDKELVNLLRKRNDSILAHGLTPVEKIDAERLFEIVKDYGQKSSLLCRI